jgi:hypothetical protein
MFQIVFKKSKSEFITIILCKFMELFVGWRLIRLV